MTKKVSIAHPRATKLADDFVKQKPGAADEPMKRLTIDIPEKLHTRMKMACAANRVKMSDAVRVLLENKWPGEKAA